MAVFNFELLRTYSTSFEIEAETQEQATRQFEAMGDNIYTQELEQCNVINEVVKGDKYARICTCCHSGMNEGFISNNYEYYCTAQCLRNKYTKKEWEELASEENSGNYWTQWEDIEDYQYQIINGILEEIN